MHILYRILPILLFSCSQSDATIYNLNDIKTNQNKIAPREQTFSSKKKLSQKKGAPKRFNSTDTLGRLIDGVRNENLAEVNAILKEITIVAQIELKCKLNFFSKILGSIINQVDSEGHTVLWYGVEPNEHGEYTAKKLKIFCKLFKYPLINILQRDKKGRNILHWAVINNNPKAVQHILQLAKARLRNTKPEGFPEFIHQKDKDGFTPLHYAVDKNENGKYPKIKLEIFDQLLQCKDMNIEAVDNDGKTILHWAVINNNPKAVQHILQHLKKSLGNAKFIEFLQIKTLGGCSAIYWTMSPDCSHNPSARATSLKIFNLLIGERENRSYPIDDQDNNGYTLAHWAIAQGRNDILKSLVNHGANFNIGDNKGHTPLHTLIITIASAIWQKNKDLMQHLYCEKDSILNQFLQLDQSRINFNIKTKAEFTALDLARKYKLPNGVINKIKSKEKNDHTLPFKKRKMSSEYSANAPI